VAEGGLARFRHAYDLDQSIEDKLHALATKIYGASGVELAPLAKEQIARYTSSATAGCRCAWRRRSTASRTIPS